MFPQLSQTFVLNHVDYAICNGHDVDLFCARRIPNVSDRVIAKIHLYKWMLYGKPLNKMVMLRVAKGLLVHPLRSLSALLKFARREIGPREALAALQIEREPDAMIANFGPNGIVAANLKKHFFPRSRLTVIFHGYDLTSYTKTHGWQAYRELAPLMDNRICVSNALADILRQETGIESSVHYLGIPLRDLPTRARNADKTFHILFVGRLVEKKGAEYLIGAVKTLIDDGFDVRAHLIGDGPLTEKLKTMADELGLRGFVYFHGAQQHDVVLRTMARSDCLVAPSVTAIDGDKEGLPVTIMEAMACELPVISTYHSGIPEIVKDGISGLLVKERDVGELGTALKTLILHPIFCKEITINAVKTIRDQFDSEQQNKTLFVSIVGSDRMIVDEGDSCRM